jgi:hypothetical protein
MSLDGATNPRPFFERQGELLVPTERAGAPWAPNMLHGRMVTALAAREVERGHADGDFECARLTVDLFRAATFDPVHVPPRRATSTTRPPDAVPRRWPR